MTERARDQRRSQRVAVHLAAVLRGTDAAGRNFFDRAAIISVDQRGARVRTRFALRVGSEVEIQVSDEKKSKRFRVVWQGQEGSLQEGLAGIEFINKDESWDSKLLQFQWEGQNF